MPFTRCTVHRDRQRDQIAFPIGGIGTGCISLTGNGALQEWQIANKPNLDSMNPHTFVALRVAAKDGMVQTRVCEAPFNGPYYKHPRSINGHYFPHNGLGDVFGLPRFRHCTFDGAYPFARVLLSDPQMPVQVEITAYNPLIPLNEDDSGIPIALLDYRIINNGDQALDVSLMANIGNPVAEHADGGRRNRYQESATLRGILFDNALLGDEHLQRGAVYVHTPWPNGFHRCYWPRLGWFDPLQQTWDEFHATGSLENIDFDDHPRGSQAGALGLQATVAAGDSVTLPLRISWFFPNASYTLGMPTEAGVDISDNPAVTRWPHWYSRRFKDVTAVADYYQQHEQRLIDQTAAFRDALESSSVSDAVLDAASSNIAILRSPTVIYLEDGTPYGYEGSNQTDGCCPGSCNHVWNYAQTADYLFPQMMQRMHRRYFKYNVSPTGSGGMAFRLSVPSCCPEQAPKAAVDGQLGTIVHCYQLWCLHADREWLQEIWPALKASLTYCWKFWDQNKSGFIDGIQHNTYDIEFFGPNPLANGYYIAALQAGGELARVMGDEDAGEFTELAIQASLAMDEMLFNGKWYQQHIDPEAYKKSEVPIKPPQREIAQMAEGEPKWQFGSGCLSDQLVGQWLGKVSGLPDLLDDDKRRSALRAIYQHNFYRRIGDLATCQRSYALNDESALVLCSWPDGGRPALPFIYCDEAWTGVEYHVAAHLIYEGMQEAGEEIVSAVRGRYNGEQRNPWCEYECGAYYARAMSSWSLMTAHLPFYYQASRSSLCLVIHQPQGTAFWSCGSGWGTLQWDQQHCHIQVIYGELQLQWINGEGAGWQSAWNNSYTELQVMTAGKSLSLAE